MRRQGCIINSGRLGSVLAAAGAMALLFAAPALAEIKIGVLLPLSGKGASYGQHQEIATKMALEELERLGGIKGEKVSAVIYDTRGENTDAISLTRKLIHTDKVLAIVGPFFSGECEVAFPVAVQGKTPIITASAAKPGIAAKNRPWAFRNALTSDRMNNELVDQWLKEHNGIKSVVVMTDIKDAFTKIDGSAIFPSVLKARDVAVLDNISFQTGDIDFAAQVTKIAQMKPDGIVIAGLYNEGGNIVREIRKQGLKQPIIGALGMSETRFLTIAGPASEGTLGVMPFWPDNPDPRVSAWVKEYSKRANTTPNNTDALIYDTMMMMKMCVEKHGVTNKPDDLAADRDKIRQCFDGIQDYAGIAGKTMFSDDGDAELEPVVLRATGGRWTSVK